MKTKPRILFFHLGQSFGGIEVYMGNLAALLRGHADIVALCSNPQLIERLEAQSVKVIHLPDIKGPLRGLRFLIAFAIFPFILSKYKIDTVHINGHWESALLLPARLLGCRVINTRHQTWNLEMERWWQAPKRKLSSVFSNVNSRFASQVVCVSDAVAGEVRKHVSRSSVQVIPNWIPCALPLTPRHPVRKTRLLFIGRLVHAKGLHLLIEAMRGLENVALMVVGEGPMLEEYRVQARGLEVEFVGFRRDVDRYYAAADIFVMPSVGMEGLPLVSLEAMGSGLPCLFSDLPVHREITDAGKGAQLFRVGNASDLRFNLSMLIGDAGLRRRVSRAAHSIVRARYTADSAYRSYLEVFQLEPATEGVNENGIDLSRFPASA